MIGQECQMDGRLPVDIIIVFPFRSSSFRFIRFFIAVHVKLFVQILICILLEQVGQRSIDKANHFICTG